MSIEECSPPPNKLPYFAGMSESVVVEISGYLGISESAQKLIRTYFAYQALGSMQRIAYECGMSTTEAEGTLYMIEDTIEKSAQSMQGEVSIQEKLAAHILRSTNRNSIVDQQKAREQNKLTQSDTMNFNKNAACSGAPIEDMDDFLSNSENKQKKMIAKYCLSCPLMDACAIEAIDENESNSSRGGFTTRALKLIINGKVGA